MQSWTQEPMRLSDQTRALNLFLPGEGGISPYMNVMRPLQLGIGLIKDFGNQS